MDPEKGKITPTTCIKFILGVTNEFCERGEKDNRIEGIFKNYAKKDPSGETLDREEFLKFYFNAAHSKLESVQENLEHHFVRLDMKKLSDVLEETALKKDEMPRYIMSD